MLFVTHSHKQISMLSYNYGNVLVATQSQYLCILYCYINVTYRVQALSNIYPIDYDCIR